MNPVGINPPSQCRISYVLTHTHTFFIQIHTLVHSLSYIHRNMLRFIQIHRDTYIDTCLPEYTIRNINTWIHTNKHRYILTYTLSYIYTHRIIHRYIKDSYKNNLIDTNDQVNILPTVQPPKKQWSFTEVCSRLIFIYVPENHSHMKFHSKA